MKADDEIKRDVEAELRWPPRHRRNKHCGKRQERRCHPGSVIPSYVQKNEAQTDVKRVQGGVGVANDLEVRLPSIDQRPVMCAAAEVPCSTKP